jgi:hypothetical protein
MAQRDRRRRFRGKWVWLVLLPLLILLRPGEWFGGGPREDGGSRPDSRPAPAGVRVQPAVPPPETPPDPSRDAREGAAPGDADRASRPSGAPEDDEAREARAEDEAARLLILAWAALREGRLADVEARLSELPAELGATRAGTRFLVQAGRVRSRVAQVRSEILVPLQQAAAQGDALALALGLRRTVELTDPDTVAQARALCGLPAAAAWDPAPLAARWPQAGLLADLKRALDAHLGDPVRAAVVGQIRRGSLHRVDGDLGMVVAVPEGGGVVHPRVLPWDLDARCLSGDDAVRWVALLALSGRRDEALLHARHWSSATAQSAAAVELLQLLR